MAKAKQSNAGPEETTPNKSQAIREALAENPTASPKQIAEIVNGKYSLGVTGQYVSVIKSNAKQQVGKTSRRGGRRLRANVVRTATTGTTATASKKTAPTNAMDAAIGLIEAAGGLDQARVTLNQLERLRGRL